MKMYKCIKCNKEFKYESKLLEHNKRKNPCNANKKNLECKYCNVTFNCQYDKNKHEKTNKLINNCNNNSKNKVMDIENIVNKYETEIEYYKNKIKELE
jgi:DNA-directed RNA polymerase subunit RPC12/RpoP